MIYINGLPVVSGDIVWQVGSSWQNEEEGVRLAFHLSSFHSQYQRRQAFQAIERIVKANHVSWLSPGPKQWTLDLDAFRAGFPDSLGTAQWLSGVVALEPEFEASERQVFNKPRYDASVVFYITPGELKHMSVIPTVPVEITDSLKRLRADHPDENNAAFIMMKFGTTKLHNEIVAAVRGVLSERGVAGLRADDKQYHDDLFPNVMTYMHGCAFGIAVFERLEANDFNPNVSLEVGYMMANRKPTCLLRDRTLPTLHTDLVGKIYRTFDPQDPASTIPAQLRQWMDDKGIG